MNLVYEPIFPDVILEKKKEIKLNHLLPIRNSLKRMNDAKNLPPITPLIGDIWQTGELHLLVADTGVGKSTLAVAYADKLSKGKQFMFLSNTNNPLCVLYYDFELSDRQFRNRYTNENQIEYEFSENFYIDSIDFAELLGPNEHVLFDDILFAKLKNDIEQIQPSILIIDNITYLGTQTTQKTDVALQIMRKLIEIKKQYNLSILVLAHTPKIDYSTPLTINSVAGSKHLSNFADSVSAIGKSILGSEIRYIKQLKPSRSGELIYDTENVITCELVKVDTMLTFQFICFKSEHEHLKQNKPQESRDEIIEKARQLKEAGKSYAEIAEILLGDPLKKGTIHKWLNQKQSK